MTRMDFAAGMTIAAVRRRLTEVLQSQCFDTPALDARVLVGHALDLDHAGLIRDAGRALTSAEIDAVASVATRRLGREPVARIVGMKEFWSLPLSINAATLVPRPETETVVEAALAAVDAAGARHRALRLLDIGTGSGALLLALLSELPNGFGVGTDVVPDALAVAHGNAVRLGLGERASFVACDMLTALRGPFDLVVSNPPYVPSEAIAALAPGVRNFEPRIALDGGPDGLNAYRAMTAQAAHVVAPGARLVVEHGADQGAAVAAIMSECGFTVTTPTHDLSGRQRVVTAVRA